VFREEFWAAEPVQNTERILQMIYIFVINLILLYTLKNKEYGRKRVVFEEGGGSTEQISLKTSNALVFEVVGCHYAGLGHFSLKRARVAVEVVYKVVRHLMDGA
jgi:hypothetical protein